MDVQIKFFRFNLLLLFSAIGWTLNGWAAPPSGSDGTITMAEDSPYTFAPADFGFSDTGDAPPNPFTRVKVATLPASGTLSFDGQLVNAGDFVSMIPVGGTNWTPREAVRSWSGVACSSDGSKLVASVSGGFLYTSTDFGVTWIQRESARNWSAVASSSSGMKLAAIELGGLIYTSADAGVTWVARASPQGWTDISSSTDGSRLIASAVGVGIYVSGDSGQTWGLRATPNEWRSVASNANGNILVAGIANGGVQVSTNSGLNWTNRTSVGFWTGVACSATGNIIAATMPGQIHVSANAGSSWSVWSANQNFKAITMSSDGMKMAAVAESGWIYTSFDTGVTWIKRGALRFWSRVATAADGSRMTAVASSSNIFTSDSTLRPLIYTPLQNLQGDAAASFTFQVEDGGVVGSNLDASPNVISFNMTSVNDAPEVVNPLPDLNAFPATPFVYQIPADAFVDPDPGDTLVFSVSLGDGAPLPAWLNFDPLTRTFSGTPSAADIGISNVKITATDSSSAALAVTADFKLVVGVVQPLGTDGSVTILEDSSHSFSPTNFGFMEGSPELANAFTRVKISSLPANGTLTSFGFPVAVGEEIRVDPVVGGLWSKAQNGGYYSSVAISDDGSQIVATRMSGKITISRDYGNTWAEKLFAFDWSDIASSASGQYLAATIYANLIYTSNDAGNTWTARASTKNWNSIALSADGSRGVAAVSYGQIFVSSDYGVTWNGKANNLKWTGVASSSDGLKLAAVASADRIYVSSDGGETWKATGHNEMWTSVCSSDDGTKLAATVSGGNIYTSTDSGATWVPRAMNQTWSSIDVSNNGNKLIASVDHGRIYVSEDAGITWTERDQKRNWVAVATSGSGNLFAGVVGNVRSIDEEWLGGVLTSVSSPMNLVFTPAPNAAGSPYASFTFQVGDDGLSSFNLDPVPNSFTVNVSPINDGPTLITPIPDSIAPKLELFNFPIPANTFNDLDAGTVFTYAGTLADGSPLPSWLSLSPLSGTFSGTPGLDAAGIFDVRLTVSDDGLPALSVSDVFRITIPTDPPQGGDSEFSIDEDQTYTLSASDFFFSDPKDSPPNNFVGVTFTTVPALGTLTLDGGVVPAGFQMRFPLVTARNTWIERGPSRKWKAIASSSDGVKLLAAEGGTVSGSLYTSSDSGETWVARESARTWQGVACSADGKRLVAVASTGGKVHISNDSGETWVERGGASTYTGVACSADGSKIVTCSSNGYLYTSHDYGVNWTARDSVRDWTSVASSADGTIMVAATLSLSTSSFIYVSVNSGVTWSARPSSGLYKNVALSADGSTLCAVTTGGVKVSSDLGMTWFAFTSNSALTAVAVSSDGTKLVAVGTTSSTSRIYVSTDSGRTWLPRDNLRLWSCVASSADGNKLVAGVADGLIYKSTAVEQALIFKPAFNGSGIPYTSFTFQVQDDGAYGGTLDPTPNTMTFNVTPLNDAPRPSALPSNKVATRNVAFSFTLPTNTFFDSDAGTVLTYAATNPDGSPLSGWISFDTSTRTFSGTPTDADAGLWPIKITATDNASPALSGSITFIISVPGSHPEGADGVVKLDEDTSYNLGPANFGFTDPNEIPANRFSRVKIVTLPEVGELKLNGVPVTAGTIVNFNPQSAWTPRASSRTWTTIKSSADGSKLAAIGGGQIYTSTDSGVSWLARESVRNWTSLACSANGNKLVAAVDGGKIYTSDDSGATWMAGPLDHNWQRVASSADGVRLYAGPGYRSSVIPFTYGGPLYVSVNSGSTWSPVGGTESWEDLAVSKNGSRLIALLGPVEMITASRSVGNVQVSSNYGATWLRKTESLSWTAVACSSDGSKVVAVKKGGQIFTSTDYGQTWIARESFRNWTAVASSADGATLVATVSTGQIYISTDSGATWLPRETNRNWSCVTISDDGLKFAAGTTNSQIFTYQIPVLAYTPPAHASGLALATMTFQVEDDGLVGTTLDPTPNTLSFQVDSVNDAPVLNAAISTQMASFNESFSFQIPAETVVDVDEIGLLQYSATSADDSVLPAWLSFNPSTRTFSGVPQPGDQRLTEIKLTVTDSGSPPLSLVTFFTVIIPSNAPSGSDFSATVLEGSSYTFLPSDFGFSDPEDTPPNNFKNLRLTSVPSQGSLSYAGVSVVPGASITLNDPLPQNVWAEREGVRYWRSITSSADGVKLATVVYGGYLYTSNNSGATWTARDQVRNWYSIACSADGTKLVAGVYGGLLYTSTDSGATWTPRETIRNWRSVASSTDGTKLIACAYNDQLFTSADSGLTWTARDAIRNWYCAASSADGSKLVAVVNGGLIYTSTDSGASWTARESVRNWRTVACSADGTRLVAIIYNGQLYTSMNSGSTWTPQDVVRGWYHVASSADGKRLAAVIANGTLMSSTDYGVTWLPRESNREWYAVASSANGEKLAAIVHNGRIYTSTSSLQPLRFLIPTNASGTPYSGFTFQVEDDGVGPNVIDPTPNTFTLNVTPVNDPPTIDPLTGGGDFTLTSTLRTVPLYGITAGGGENQEIAVTATSSNPLIIPHPTINYTSPATTGSISLAPTGNLAGTVLITVKVQDNGGTGNGGIDTIQTTFSILVRTQYQTWASSNGVPWNASLNGGSNLLNFAFGLAANTGAKGSIAVAESSITRRGGPNVLSANGADFTALFGRRKNSGLTYTAQFSSNLNDWENSTASPTVVAEDEEMEACVIPFPAQLGSGRKPQYFRLMLTY